MTFEWHKISKYEENYERDITDNVYDYVRDYYDVDEIDDLTEEQMDEVKTFRDEYNDYLNMKGFIFDNNYGMEFLMYEGLIQQMKEASLNQNDEINGEEQQNLLD